MTRPNQRRYLTPYVGNLNILLFQGKKRKINSRVQALAGCITRFFFCIMKSESSIAALLSVFESLCFWKESKYSLNIPTFRRNVENISRIFLLYSFKIATPPLFSILRIIHPFWFLITHCTVAAAFQALLAILRPAHWTSSHVLLDSRMTRTIATASARRMTVSHVHRCPDAHGPRRNVAVRAAITSACR